MTKLLIVDDSALMRRQLSEVFSAEGDFEVKFARNGEEAVAANLEFEPDVMTLDINMPEMDGLSALSRIMVERPLPVVMVSSLTEQGALATFEALNLGAVDYIPKPGGTISLSIGSIRDQLVAKVRAAARARVRGRGTAQGLVQKIREQRRQVEAARPEVVRRVGGRDGMVLIGVSTGGPRTLEEMLPRLPAEFPWPVLVAQHMPPTFTRSFAERLDQICALRVVEAAQPMPVEASTVYIGKGGADMVLSNRAGVLHVVPKPESPQHLWHPSVELMGRSALETCDPPKVIAIMLTGMGNDGSDAFTELKRRGARTIAESEETSVVFGMPKELIEKGGASLVLPSDRIIPQVTTWVGR